MYRHMQPCYYETNWNYKNIKHVLLYSFAVAYSLTVFFFIVQI